MKAKANYYGGLSHLIGPAQLAGPGPPGALARCNLQAMRGGGGQRATDGRKSGPLDRLERGAWGGEAVGPGALAFSGHCAAPRRAAGYDGAAAAVVAGCHPAASRLWRARGGGMGKGGRSDGQMALRQAGSAPPRPAPPRLTAGYGGGAATVAEPEEERRTAPRAAEPASPRTAPPP